MCNLSLTAYVCVSLCLPSCYACTICLSVSLLSTYSIYHFVKSVIFKVLVPFSFHIFQISLNCRRRQQRHARSHTHRHTNTIVMTIAVVISNNKIIEKALWHHHHNSQICQIANIYKRKATIYLNESASIFVHSPQYVYK